MILIYNFFGAMVRMVVALLVGFVMIGMSGPSNPVNVPTSEIIALQELYNSTNGAWWLWRPATSGLGAQWNFEHPFPCSGWQGVDCSTGCYQGKSEMCTVTYLNLSSYNLSGTIPESIGNLWNLTVFALPHNLLTGTLPSTVSKMTNLQVLDLGSLLASTASQLFFLHLEERSNLSRTMETGKRINTDHRRLVVTPPASIAEFDESNKLIGTIPSEIGNLKNLTHFDISHNGFTGSLPHSLTKLTSIVFFNVVFNQFTGKVYSEFGLFQECEALLLYGNALNGTIPTELGQMHAIKQLILSGNELVGTLPTELGQLPAIRNFGVFGNRLQGNLITEIANLTTLVDLSLGFNFFSGTVPVSYYANLTNLYVLSIEGNRLTGSISTHIGLMTNLNALLIDGNLLSGSLPKEIVNATYLIVFLATLNYFSSTLPSELFSMQQLLNFDFGFNEMTGSIPPEIGYLPILQNCSYTNYSASYNFTMPSNSSDDVADMLYARLIEAGSYVGLSANYFTGTIPTTIVQLTCLSYLLMFGNSLSGPLPKGLGNLQALAALVLDYNKLSGPILPELTNIPAMVQFTLDDNLFTGTIPTNLSLWKGIRSIEIGSNFLTGTISGGIEDCIELATFSVYSNHFSGRVPLSLANLDFLSTLLLSDNLFTGSLDFFDVTSDVVSLMRLSTFDGSGNAFSGTIPESLFSLPAIETLALTKNCFYGTITKSICDTKLKTVTLNGLSSGESCQIPLFPVFRTYTARYLDGSVPTCIFSMESLVSLQLSGNGLTGTLPDLTALPSSFLNISLSHNRLSGTVPTAFTAGSLSSLDLRSNALEGICEYMGSFYDATSHSRQTANKYLALSYNRLSGNLPASFRDAANIDVLTGNLFGCRDKSELPNNDPYLSQASCGTALLTWSLIGFLSFFTIFLAVVGTLVYYGSKQNRGQQLKKPSIRDSALNRQSTDSFRGSISWDDIHVDEVREIDREISSLETEYFMRMMVAVKSVAGILFVIVIAVLLPIYAALKMSDDMSYTTHTFQYALFPAATYFRGRKPAIVLFILTLILAFLLQFQILSFTSSLRKQMAKSMHKSKHISWKHIDYVYRNHSQVLLHSSMSSVAPSSLPLSLGYFVRLKQFYEFHSIRIKNIAFIIVDVVVISVINGGFVYIILTQGQVGVLLAEFSLAFIKVYWNNVFMPRVLDQINSSKILTDNQSRDPSTIMPSSSDGTIVFGRAKKLDIQVALSIFNTVVSPITCLLVDGNNCFLHTFFQNETITSAAIYESCHVTDFTGRCVELPHKLLSAFVPPFLYSFQCSSEFIRNYSMVFVFMYMYLAVVGPAMSFLCAFLFLRAPEEQNSDLLGMLREVLVSNSLLQPRAPMVMPSTDADKERVSSAKKTETAASRLSFSFGNIVSVVMGTINADQQATQNGEPQNERDLVNRKYVYNFLTAKTVRVDKTTSKLMVDLSVLVTFGFAYVPLGCIVCLSMFVTCIEWRVMMSRLCLLYDRCVEFRDKPFDIVRCEGVIDNFERFQWALVFLLCWFFAFFVYDTSNGEFEQGSWASIILVVWPVILRGIAYGKKKLFPKFHILEDIEMVSSNLVSSMPGSKSTDPTVYIQDADTRAALRQASSLDENSGVRIISEVNETSFNSEFESNKSHNVRNPIHLSNSERSHEMTVSVSALSVEMPIVNSTSTDNVATPIPADVPLPV